METIKLRDYYPYYTHDSFVELPNEVAAVMKPYKIEEQSQRRRMRLHKVYSLDRGGLDGLSCLPPCPHLNSTSER